MACFQAQCLATGFGVDGKEFIDPRYDRGRHPPLLQRLHTLSAVFVCDPSANRVGSTCARVLSGSAASFPLLATAARAGVVATNFGRRGRKRLLFHGTATQPPEQSLPLGKQRI